MTIHELLLRRSATKKFDTTKKVSEEDLTYILEAGRLSCSSVNIQPWHITVITNPDLRVKLRAAGYDQAQITDASHLLVVSCLMDPTPRIAKTTALIKAQAGEESAMGYKKMAEGWTPKTPEAILGWLKLQTYLTLQAMILAAADRGIDSCPMEGFHAEQFGEILGFKDKIVCTLLPIGYATEQGHTKVRVPLEDMVEYRA